VGGSTHTIEKNTGTLVVASLEIGLEVNADKVKYVNMSWDQNARWNHNVKIDNSSLEGWKSSYIWEQTWQIKIPVRKKLRADWTQGILAIIQFRIIDLPVCYPKI